MAGPFKMKGFSGFGNSPTKKTEKIKIVDARSKTRKAWDKATQLGMGFLGGLKGLASEPGDQTSSQPYSYPFRDTIKGAKDAYKKEKRHDWAQGLREKVIK